MNSYFIMSSCLLATSIVSMEIPSSRKLTKQKSEVFTGIIKRHAKRLSSASQSEIDPLLETNRKPDTVTVELIPETISHEELKEKLLNCIQERDTSAFKKIIEQVPNEEAREFYISKFVQASGKQEWKEIADLFTKTPITSPRRFGGYKGSSLWGPNTGKPE